MGRRARILAIVGKMKTDMANNSKEAVVASKLLTEEVAKKIQKSMNKSGG